MYTPPPASPFTPRKADPEAKFSKLIYSARNIKRLKCAELRPDLAAQCGDEYVLECEHYVHGDWRHTRTSLVVSYDEVTRQYTTLNSIYEDTDPVKGVAVKVISDDEMPADEPGRDLKQVLTIRNMKRVQCGDGLYFLEGVILCHNGWWKGRTSVIVAYDPIRNIYESRNTIYRVVVPMTQDTDDTLVPWSKAKELFRPHLLSQGLEKFNDLLKARGWPDSFTDEELKQLFNEFISKS